MASLTRDSVDGMNLVSGMTRTPLLESLSTLLLERDRPGRRSESSLNATVAIDVQLDCWIYAYSIAISSLQPHLDALRSCYYCLRIGIECCDRSFAGPPRCYARLHPAQRRPGYQERPDSQTKDFDDLDN